MSFVIRGCIDQPITLRENKSTTTARYSQLSGSYIGYVCYPTFIQCFWVELPLELVGRHNTGFTFARPWASVSDLSLYPHTLHQPPDFVYNRIVARNPADRDRSCGSHKYSPTPARTAWYAPSASGQHDIVVNMAA